MVNDTIPRVNMKFLRTGNMSVYGNLNIEYISEIGKHTLVGIAKGIAVYTPNSSRRFQLDLDRKKGIDYHSGKLSFKFTSDIGSKSSVLAEDEIILKY